MKIPTIHRWWSPLVVETSDEMYGMLLFKIEMIINFYSMEVFCYSCGYARPRAERLHADLHTLDPVPSK